MKSFKFIILICFISLFYIQETKAEFTCFFQHYSSKDGLPQYTVMDILQDHKGFMWFATWNGFSKFDGQNFKNYKVTANNNYYMLSNRIEKLYEDKFGNIWMQSYDNEAHRFNPKDETFKGIRSISGYNHAAFQLSKLKIQPSGKVWLLSDKNGAICVVNEEFDAQVYNQQNGKILDNKVIDVYEDKHQDSWLLTQNGLYHIVGKNAEIKAYFSTNKSNSDSQSFYACHETDKNIWFGSNAGRIWLYSKTNNKFDDFKLPTTANITGFKQIADNDFFIATDADGFFVFNTSTTNIQHYNTANTKELEDNAVRIIFVDSDRQVWFESDKLGISKYNGTTKNVKTYHVYTDDKTLSTFPAYAMIVEDVFKQVWVQPKGGGFSLYNRKTDSLNSFYNSDTSPEKKFSNIIHSLFSDKQGNLWFCTRSHGLEKVVFSSSAFHTQKISVLKKSSTSNDVRSCFEDDLDRLWVATKDGSISILNQQFQKIGSLSANGTIGNNQIFTGVAYCMMMDKNQNIWIGTKGEGLFKLTKTNNPLKYNIEQYKNDSKNIYSVSDNLIYSIYQDSKSNIWIATYGGGLNLVKSEKNGEISFVNYRNHLKNYPIDSNSQLRYITETKSGNIAIGTTTGLVMFSSYFTNPDNIEFKIFRRENSNRNNLSDNDIHGVCYTRKGDMYLATFGGGLNKVTEWDNAGFPVSFKAFTTSEGIASDVCLNTIEDVDGNLWISHESELSSFNPDNEHFNTYPEVSNLMTNTNFSEAAVRQLKNGYLVFGYSDGLLYFQVKNITKTNFVPYLAFSSFRLFNRLVSAGTENSPLKLNIDDIPKLVLARDQNFFSIEYAALDYVQPDNIQYAYMLEGVDNDWVYGQKGRSANYANLAKGDYIFHVKSTNSEGVWVDNERTLPITILPSVWETPLAILFYIVVVIALVWFGMHLFLTFYRLRNKVKVEKQLSEVKLRFFTDISHEIRTPLTMISAPVENLLNEKDISEKARKQLKLIEQSTNRMLRLVNQILDFRKMQQISLKVVNIDLGTFVQKIAEDFNEAAKAHQIEFNFRNEAPNEKIWVDNDCLEKIIINLFSNAFKYTPDGKSITVTVRGSEKYLTVEVQDKGIGIAKEKQKSLFNRFASYNEDKSKPSTGIGLYMVKDLVDKHGGKVSVISELGEGSTFAVSFVRGFAHFGKEVEIIGATQTVENKETTQIYENNVHQLMEDQNKVKSTSERILVVEDDDDLRLFIKTVLEKEYSVYEAKDGEEGLQKAIDIVPDFVVSDVMMPRMDGIELLQKLKNNIQTSHIPVILLTAKTAIDNKLEGLSYGADDYITKPFSVQYLKARISNLLEQRKRLQQIYRLQLTDDASSKEVFVTEKLAIEDDQNQLSINPHDEKLMQKVIAIIEENLDNSEFSIETLGAIVGMSRSVFFNKIKSLTGLSPVVFVRDVRMKKAAVLLSSGSYMVKEVSFMVGISDVKYFGKCFKEKYGITPQEYKNNYGNV